MLLSAVIRIILSWKKKIKLGDIVKLHAVMVMYGTIRGISFILWMQELRVS